MTENNNIEKAKFFAQYWGQNVYRNDPRPGNNGQLNYRIFQFQYLLEEGCYLELTPLSNINNEDAIGVAKLVWPNCEPWKYNCRPLGIAYITEPKYQGKFQQDVVDFLRSKGYLLPWRDLSVEELINRGWVKLKMKKL